MKSTFAPYAAAAVVLGAAGWALLHNQGSVPEPAPSQGAVAMGGDPATPHETTPAVPSETFLPAGHPPIPSGAPGAAGSMGAMGAMAGPSMGAGSAADATITWTPPGVWQVAPNPNAMRLATYHPSPAVDVSVSRAGGSTDANIERWVHQFEEASPPRRTDSKIKGLDVHAVEVSGTYAGGGMMGGAPQTHEGWSLVGAVVEATDAKYFFKMVGPSDQVAAAHAAFDGMVRSVSPKAP